MTSDMPVSQISVSDLIRTLERNSTTVRCGEYGTLVKSRSLESHDIFASAFGGAANSFL